MNAPPDVKKCSCGREMAVQNGARICVHCDWVCVMPISLCGYCRRQKLPPINQ